MTNSSTPLRQQYLKIKKRHADAILLFRIGDFYEAFDDDARLLARELSIVLTSKPMGKNVRVPLAGVPHHSLERHLATLIERGYRVAICEQLTPVPVKGADTGRGLIERDVVRIVTPGTVLEPGLLSGKNNNFLAALATDGKQAAVAHADVSTGYFAVTQLPNQISAIAELERIAPAELLIPQNYQGPEFPFPTFVTRRPNEEFSPQMSRRILLKHFQAKTLEPMGLSARTPLLMAAAGAIIAYLLETQNNAVEQLSRLTTYQATSFMTLDGPTIRSLEIFASDGDSPSLLDILDRTRTDMGGRLLRRWLRQPLLNIAEIIRRQEIIEWFYKAEKSREEINSVLREMSDLERLAGRARAKTITPRELLALGRSLELITRLRAILQREGERFRPTLVALPECQVAADLIRRALADEDLSVGKQRTIIRDGFSEELDRLRGLLRDGRKFLAEIEQRERARTGIKSLRVGYNKVFGYYIEVTKPNLHLIPSDYTRKQTLTSAERFITLELKEHETLVTNAAERMSELESSLFRHVCTEVGKQRDEILIAAATVAFLDTMISLAEAAHDNHYVRPEMTEEPVIVVKDGRHPVIERTLTEETFVANDVSLGGAGRPQIALITGPNMSGKSTYLRQTAMIALMAQTGSFVPASYALVGICDRIFIRAGLYDRIGRGESTFMTEMVETANILHHASPRSLVLLDELGRGTSTYDGLSVARAVLEYIHNHPQVRSRTLFATHYHELTELAGLLPRLANFCVEIAEQDGQLVFLHKISEGNAGHSYGVYAASLAGLPRPIIRRAEELLALYESRAAKHITPEIPAASQESNFALESETRIFSMLKNMDLDSLSPVEALMKLYELREEISQGPAAKNSRQELAQPTTA